MSADPLRERGQYVADLSSAVADGAGGLQDIPPLLRLVLADGGWREFVTPRGDRRSYTSFEEFVTRPPLAGLGAESVAQLQRLVGDDAETLSLIDKATQRPVGRPKKETLDNIKGFPSGTSETQALRRLRKDRPDLHAEVLADKLSPHAAMIRAGFRPKTISVPVARPEAAAAALRRHMSAEDLALFVKYLHAKDTP